MKKIITLFAVLLMAVPRGFAAEFIDFGTCGYLLSWQLDSRGILYIFLDEGSTTGTMTDFSSANAVPWHSYTSTIKTVSIEDGVTNIGDYAFSGCSKLSSINLPEGLTAIGKLAFEDCSALTELQLPKSLKKLGYGALEFTGLEELVIPKGVALSQMVCWSCTSLRSVKLPSDLDTIPYYAFNHCTSLQTIDIPRTVKYVGGYAFSTCSSIGSVTCRAKLPPEMGLQVFYDANINLKSLYVPSGSEGAYAAADQWNAFWVKTIPREEVYSCEFTGFDAGALSAGMAWTDEAESAVWGHVHPVEANVPYHVESNMAMLYKDEPSVGNEVEEGEILTEGTNYFLCGQIRIDGEYGEHYCFPEGEDDLVEVTMDGTPWTAEEATGEDTYSFTWICSPAFTVSRKQGVDQVSQTSKVQSRKMFRHGQLLIERNGKMFNAIGVEVK